MCATFEINPTPEIKQLIETMGISSLDDRGLRLPSSTIQFISQDANDRYVDDAKWWLLQKNGKASAYSTFNTRADKLYTGYGHKFFKANRCIIPASSFIEGDGPPNQRYYHQVTGDNKAIALGGIYTINKFAGKNYYSASVITCAGNPKLNNVHSKRVPLLLNYEDDEMIDRWLDPSFNNINFFKPMLNGHIPYDLMVTPITGARDMSPKADSFLIKADV